MTLTPFLVVFFAFGFTTVALALYRKFISMHEDDFVHLADPDGKVVAQQLTTAEKIHKIDVFGETLTILTAVAGLVVIGVYVYIKVTTYSAY